MNKHDENDINQYLKDNNLLNSYIPKQFLYQVRPTKPDIKIVVNNPEYMIFFEETQGSLRNRHYGYSKDRKKTYNLLIKHKAVQDEVILFTKNDIKLLNDIDIIQKEEIINYLNNDKKHKNCGRKKLGRKPYQIYLTDKEKPIVWEFVRRLRESHAQ